MDGAVQCVKKRAYQSVYLINSFKYLKGSCVADAHNLFCKYYQVRGYKVVNIGCV